LIETDNFFVYLGTIMLMLGLFIGAFFYSYGVNYAIQFGIPVLCCIIGVMLLGLWVSERRELLKQEADK